jgi:Alpha/beta hydrolase family
VSRIEMQIGRAAFRAIRPWAAGLVLLALAILGGAAILASDREPLVLNERERSRLPGQFVALSHGFTNYEIMGPTTGPVIVLIPGISIPRTVFARTVAPLAEAGYRVIAYDLYGRGFSDRPRVRYDAALFNQQIDDLLQALRIDGPINLVGLASAGSRRCSTLSVGRRGSMAWFSFAPMASTRRSVASFACCDSRSRVSSPVGSS